MVQGPGLFFSKRQHSSGMAGIEGPQKNIGVFPAKLMENFSAIGDSLLLAFFYQFP